MSPALYILFAIEMPSINGKLFLIYLIDFIILLFVLIWQNKDNWFDIRNKHDEIGYALEHNEEGYYI